MGRRTTSTRRPRPPVERAVRKGAVLLERMGRELRRHLVPVKRREEIGKLPGGRLPSRPLSVLKTIGYFLKALALPLWPVWALQETRDASYLRDYLGTIRRFVRTAFIMARQHSVQRMLKYNTTSTAAVSAAHAERQGACTRCGKCCVLLKCPGLAWDPVEKLQTCKGFGSSYWSFGPCGRFPIDQSDVHAYQCPGFSFVGFTESWRKGRRRLPVADVENRLGRAPEDA